MANQSVQEAASYLDDLLSRRYSAVCLNADRHIAATMRAADRVEILRRASREMTLIRHCEDALAKCKLGGVQ